MAMKERTGRSRVSKANQVSRKIETSDARSTTTRVRPSSKADDIARKIPGASSSAASSTRVRPSSKADDIARKIPGASSQSAAAPTRVRPSSKADEVSRKIPTGPRPASDRPAAPQPQQASARTPRRPYFKPYTQRRSGCCLLPFTLAVLGIIGSLIAIF